MSAFTISDILLVLTAVHTVFDDAFVTSYRKVGGVRFLKVGRVFVSWSLAKHGKPAQCRKVGGLWFARLGRLNVSGCVTARYKPIKAVAVWPRLARA
jgi:hypothetical protein